MYLRKSLFVLVAMCLSIALVGCGGSTTGPTTQGGEEAEIEKALAKLSPEDQKAAREQKVCPVTEEPLGSMGVPEKVKVKDQEVFICCAGCEDKLKAEPDKYLKNISKQK